MHRNRPLPVLAIVLSVCIGVLSGALLFAPQPTRVADGSTLILTPTSAVPTAVYLPMIQRSDATPAPAVRAWPDTTAGVHVFNDQLLPNLSDAQ